MSKGKTSYAMTKRKKRTTLDMNRDNFNDQAIKGYYDTRYSTAWKAATIELSTNISEANQGTHGFGANAVAKKYNENLLNSPNDNKIKKTTLTRAVHSGEVGASPKNQGRPNKIPPGFAKACATHATMMQLSGGAEASGPHMSATIQALAHGTKWDGEVKTEYSWRRVWVENPAILNPAQVKSHKDRRVDWLKFNNINLWTVAAKKYLIGIYMLEDKPDIICK